MPASCLRHVRAISLDVTGTLIRHLDPIAETYANALAWSAFPKRITAEELKPSFKTAYFKTLRDFPCFGAAAGLSSRQWWVRCVKTCLSEAGLTEGEHYSAKDFNRWFRRVYQHYGCPAGYVPMGDALPFVRWASRQGYLLAITTNTPCRTMDTVLPFMGLHQYFRCFTCSQDVGAEKPDRAIFDHSLEEMQHCAARIAEGIIEEDHVREFDPAGFNQATVAFTNRYEKMRGGGAGAQLQPDQVLHVGDSMPADLCGPKAAGWNGMYLDRTSDPNVRVYQDWLVGPDYPGKSEQDIRENTVFSLDEVRAKLEEE